MFSLKKKIIVLSPHPEDGEIGCEDQYKNTSAMVPNVGMLFLQ